MIHWNNGNKMVQRVEELPNFAGVTNLYLDFETASFDPKRGGDSPYSGDRICGVAVTADDNPSAYYVPIRHRDSDANLSIEPVRRWLREMTTTCGSWVNHNVGRFDAHFLEQEGIEFDCKLVCTLTLAKLHDSDKIGYGLKELCRTWLGMEMAEERRLHAYLEGIKSKDFADAPADILGEYACMDVQGNRALYHFLDENCPDSVRGVWDTEIALTPVLYDIEKEGMHIHPTECKIEKFKSAHLQLNQLTELASLVGYEFNPKSPAQTYDLLINQCGLPVLGYNKNDNPSFDKFVLPQYSVHPLVTEDPKLHRIVELINSYRKEAQFDSLFLEPYLQLNVDGILHPSYNQCVKTGRLSCSRPNAQQLNKRAKQLIHPPEGEAILSCDYSQIEFRLIAHYINDIDAIAAYREDPNTDFHQWVAEICGTTRKPAKTMNFMMGYGGGKAKTISSLQTNPDIVEEITAKVAEIYETGLDRVREEVLRLLVNKQAEDSLKLETESYRNTNVVPIVGKSTLFKALCEERGRTVYDTYHERLPGIKRKTYEAATICKRRGYVFNQYGRRRILPPKASFRAFNSVIQSCAADVMKERLVALAPRYNKEIRDLGIRIFALVHDDISMQGPKEVLADVETQKYVKSLMESPSQKFRVPILTDVGYSEKDWAEASGDAVYKDGEWVAGSVEW